MLSLWYGLRGNNLVFCREESAHGFCRNPAPYLPSPEEGGALLMLSAAGRWRHELVFIPGYRSHLLNTVYYLVWLPSSETKSQAMWLLFHFRETDRWLSSAVPTWQACQHFILQRGLQLSFSDLTFWTQTLKCISPIRLQVSLKMGEGSFGDRHYWNWLLWIHQVLLR